MIGLIEELEIAKVAEAVNNGVRTFYLNSSGGIVHNACAITDILNRNQCELIASGLVASCAVPLFLFTKKSNKRKSGHPLPF